MPDNSKGVPPAPRDRMPTPTRVAAILLGVLAALLLINAILSLTGREAIVDSIAEAARDRGDEFNRDDLNTQLMFSIWRDAIVGVVAAVAVVLLARRLPAGRWLGIGSAVILLALAVLTVIGVGGIPIYSLLLIVITAAIIVMLFRRQTLDWLRPETETETEP